MAKKRQLPIFWIALVLFLAPFFAANWLYNHTDSFKIKTKNHGTLIYPTAHVSELGLTDFEPDAKWWLMIITPETCDESCQDMAHWLNQIQLALHKESGRVKRAVLTTQMQAEITQHLQREYPDLNITQTPVLPDFMHNTPGVAIMDPRGNIMMRFSMDTDPNDIFKDIKVLLKNSQIG